VGIVSQWPYLQGDGGTHFEGQAQTFWIWTKGGLWVTEDYDARFSAMREQILILLDRKDAHGRGSTWSPFLLEGAIFAKSDLTICVKRLKAPFFVLITLQPTFLVPGVNQQALLTR
jgi:hypothetical protein